MAQYRLLVEQGMAGIAAALQNRSSELIGKILRVEGKFRQVRVLIAFILAVEGFGRIRYHAMHVYSPRIRCLDFAASAVCKVV